MTSPAVSAFGRLPAGKKPPGARRTMKDEVATHIRETILDGIVKPGSKIDLDEIAELLGVSRLPVREALIQLESEGLVETRTHRGSYVAMLTPDDVRDHYRMYGLIRGMATARAAEILTEEQLQELDDIVTTMENSDDTELLSRLNAEFHRRINLAGSSGRLLAVLKFLANSLPGRFYELVPSWRFEANEHHREIVRLLRARDGEAAGKFDAAHSAAGAEYAVQVLTERGFFADTSK